MKTVLIAAERDLEHNLLSEALGSQGYAITRSRDGLSALETARAHPPRVLIANVSLPRMDGFALYRRWQADEQLHHIPVILYSPRSSDDKSARFAAELGATRFVANALKPDGGLLRAVEDALSIAPAAVEKPVAPAGLDEARARQSKAAQIISIEARQLRERIAEQQQTLQALEEKLAVVSAQGALFMANPLAMWVIDKHTRRMLAVNPAALQLFGYSEAEFLNLTAENLVRAQGTLPMATNVMAYQHKQGHALSLLLASSDIHYNGVAAELIAVNDVSYRVRGERAVVEEAQRVKAILAAMPLPYWMMDEQGRLLDVNEPLCRLTGYRRGELLGVTMDGLVPEAKEVQQLLAATAAQTVSATMRHQEGRSLPVDILIGQSEFSRTRMALVHERIEQTAPASADTIITGPQQNTRLSAALEILRYAEDASEATLLHYATAQIAAAFDSPIALFAEAERVTQTYTVGALCNAQNNKQNSKRNSITGPQLLPAGWQVLFKQRQTLVVDGLDHPEQALVTLPNGIELARYMICPINGRDGDVWLLLVGNRESAYGLAEQAELLECGEVLASVLKRERQQLKTRQAQQRAENLGQSMVTLLGKLLDHHDAYAAGSGNRVAALAVLFAQKLGLSAERQHALSIAARLHDVGHLLLPQSLLLRPSAFSDGERVLMQGHAEEGAQLLRGIEFGVEVASIVHQHHERMDGSGYPQKLKGEDILIEARILAVADVLEALCAARPHRAARPLQEALAILNEGSGTLYDASVVTVCNELCGNGGFVWPL